MNLNDLLLRGLFSVSTEFRRSYSKSLEQATVAIAEK